MFEHSNYFQESDYSQESNLDIYQCLSKVYLIIARFRSFIYRDPIM